MSRLISKFTAYYDLRENPPSYDATTFLLKAEYARIETHLDRVEVVVIRAPFRHRYWKLPAFSHDFLVDNIVLPMCQMLPSANVSCVPMAKREVQSFGFNDGSYSARAMYGLLGKIRPLRPKQDRDKNPRLLTMTLRESAHWTVRNSNVPEWLRAAEILLGHGYQVTIVPDTAKIDKPPAVPAGVNIDIEAATHLETRAQLYRSAACNLFVNNGPAWFALALDAPVVMLRPTCEGAGFLASANIMARNGIPKNGQISGAPRYQRLVWSDDQSDQIVQAAKSFLEECYGQI